MELDTTFNATTPDEIKIFVNSKFETTFEVFLKSIKLKNLITARVPHCWDAWALIIEGLNGWKIIYSGDCRPSENLIKAAGKNVTLLIHEATMTNDLLNEAISRNHSTDEEALTVSKEISAYRTILTHFSLRRARIPLEGILSQRYPERNTTVPAFDLMTVNLKDLPYLPLLIPSLQQLHHHVEGRLN